MKRIIPLLIVLQFISFTNAFAGGPDLKDKAKISMAKQKLYGFKYKEALAGFKEVYVKYPEDGFINYYMGLCYYNLKQSDSAVTHFEKAKVAKETDVEAFYYLGELYIGKGKIDDALSTLATFKSKASKAQIKDFEPDRLITQCNNAKTMMNTPVNVKVENAGAAINSAYDDKTPCISADGKKLIFTSRRPETTDAPVDVNGDGGFFSDIYFSLWDTTAKKWGEADPVPGSINTAAHEGVLGISPDGKQVFIFMNDENGDSRGGDIYVSKISGTKWKTPEPLGSPVNTSYYEGAACLSPDGKTMYFISDNPNYGKEKNQGKESSDIWMVEKISKTEWGKPVNLGPEVNSPFHEEGIFLAPDGKTLFFSSNRPESMGDYDIFKTVKVNGKWTKPVNLGYPVNSIYDDGPFVVSADARVGYMASKRPGGLGGKDIYTVDLSNYSVLEVDMQKKSNNGLSILKGAVRDGFQGTGMEGIEVKITDETGAAVASVNTDQNGEYFITLKGNAKYKIVVEKAGFVKIEETVDLPLGKNGDTFSLEKQFLLNKTK